LLPGWLLVELPSQLTSCSRLLLVKLTVPQLFKKFPAPYNPNAQYRIRNSPPLVSVFSQTDSVQNPILSKIHCNIMPPATTMSTKLSVSVRFPNKTYMYSSSTPYAPHVPPILSSLISSPEQHMMRSRKHEAPHYAVFSNHQILSPYSRKTLCLCSSLNVNYQPYRRNL